MEYANETGYAQQPTDEPHPMKPRFRLDSDTLPLTPHYYSIESGARRDAEKIARAHRGHEISVLFVVATVTEPLPNLEWTDGAPAGDRHQSNQIMGLDQPRPMTAEEHYKVNSDNTYSRG